MNKNLPLPSSPHSISTTISSWLSGRKPNTARVYARAYEDLCTRLDLSLESPYILEVDIVTVRAYLELLTRGGLSHNTIATTFSALRSLWDYFSALGMVSTNPWSVKTVKVSHKPQNPTPGLSIDEVGALLASINPSSSKDLQDYAALAVFLSTSMRQMELLNLATDDIRTEGGRIILRCHGETTKNGKTREVPLPEWAALALSSHLKASPPQEGGRLFKISPRHLRRRIVDLMHKAGIKGRSVHSLRVTAITEALRQGAGHYEVQAMSGHSSVQMVERYDRRRVAVEENPSLKLTYKKPD